MTDDYKGSEEILARTHDFLTDHRNVYISSGGAQGHIVHYGHVAVDWYLPALLLETIGRKSGKRYIAPLIYGFWAGEWVVIGSKGGSVEHPAWFLNLSEQKDVVFQVATQAFRANWRVSKGSEREAVWNYMEALFPNYAQYKAAVTREIPVVMLKPIEPAPILRE